MDRTWRGPLTTRRVLFADLLGMGTWPDGSDPVRAVVGHGKDRFGKQRGNAVGGRASRPGERSPDAGGRA